MNNYDFNGKNILVVDDDLASAMLVSHMLKGTGAKVCSVQDGAHAVNKAAVEDIDMILMDLRMPVMDGYAATTNIRAMGRTMPIIAYTALPSSENKDRCLAVGCNDYLSKPINKEELFKMVEKYLR